MCDDTKGHSLRWAYLVLGVAALLFAGIIYGWSILKAPLGEAFGWSASDLALNFTLTMCFFCLGGTVGGLLARRLGTRLTLILSGVLACVGFVLASRMGEGIWMLYVSYGLLAGLGIGMAYNVIISTVSAWFPDKKGLCSGALMMGFGASALVVGSAADLLIHTESVGWRTTFLLLGMCLGVVIVLSGLLLRLPGADTVLPQAREKVKAGKGEAFESRDYTPFEMLRRPTFWLAFVCITFLAAVGNTVISFAMDLSLSVGASAGLATTLVGVLSVCNGLGRILTGALFDRLGRRSTMLLANLVAILAAAVTLVSVFLSSVPLCVAGLCVTGVSYGACPTISSAFVASFYGQKNFSINFSVMNFNLMFASFMATAASLLLTASGGYMAPFVMLLALAVVALILNVNVRRP